MLFIDFDRVIYSNMNISTVSEKIQKFIFAKVTSCLKHFQKNLSKKYICSVSTKTFEQSET